MYEVHMTELRGDYSPELPVVDDKIMAETDVLVAYVSMIEPRPHRSA